MQKKTQHSELVVSYELIDGLLKVKISTVHVKVPVVNFPMIRSELPNRDCDEHIFLLHDVLLWCYSVLEITDANEGSIKVQFLRYCT